MRTTAAILCLLLLAGCARQNRPAPSPQPPAEQPAEPVPAPGEGPVVIPEPAPAIEREPAPKPAPEPAAETPPPQAEQPAEKPVDPPAEPPPAKAADKLLGKVKVGARTLSVAIMQPRLPEASPRFLLLEEPEVERKGELSIDAWLEVTGGKRVTMAGRALWNGTAYEFHPFMEKPLRGMYFLVVEMAGVQPSAPARLLFRLE